MKMNLIEAQTTIEIRNQDNLTIKIAVLPFRGQNGTLVSDIVSHDLQISGQFKVLKSFEQGPDLFRLPADHPFWENQKFDLALVGESKFSSSGKFEIKYRLVDTISKKDLDFGSLKTTAKGMRKVAHRIADSVYERLTGTVGSFAGSIAYVSQTKDKKQYQIKIADTDGGNPQVILKSKAPIISLSWSPDGRQLAYVSFEKKKPIVFRHHVLTGERHIVANFDGSNSAPSWSPDGKKMALVLTIDGISQIYVVELSSLKVQRVINSNNIDTEPVFSPNGKEIYFVSDRSGSPQIYRLLLGNGEIERVSFDGKYNVNPKLDQSGLFLVYSSRREKSFKIQLLNLESKREKTISDGPLDEKPSFSPNGQLILYTKGGAQPGQLVVTTANRNDEHLSVETESVLESVWNPKN